VIIIICLISQFGEHLSLILLPPLNFILISLFGDWSTLKFIGYGRNEKVTILNILKA
jgi:hypothetical protein